MKMIFFQRKKRECVAGVFGNGKLSELPSGLGRLWFFAHHDIQAATPDSHIFASKVRPFFILVYFVEDKFPFYPNFPSRFERTKETSPCAQCGLKCCICCFFCLEKFIRYMNHNAYTVVAIEGTHFCNAARIVSHTLMLSHRNKKYCVAISR